MNIHKRLNFITGKGGVGKSTVCKLLAQEQAKEGKKVLIVELDSRDSFSFEPKKISTNLYGIFIPPREALKEYIIKQVKFEKIYTLLFDNRIMNFFLDVAPGIEEIAMMGKIFYLEQEKKKNKYIWDIIFIDAPATGHGLYFFKAPQVFLDISQIGPIAHMAQKMQEMLLDTKRTAIHLVSLPEELPVQETIELYEELKKLGLPIGEIFLNKIISLNAPLWNITCSTSLSKKIETTIYKLKKRSQLQQEYKKILEKSLKKSVTAIPWFLEGLPHD